MVQSAVQVVQATPRVSLEPHPAQDDRPNTAPLPSCAAHQYTETQRRAVSDDTRGAGKSLRRMQEALQPSLGLHQTALDNATRERQKMRNDEFARVVAYWKREISHASGHFLSLGNIEDIGQRYADVPNAAAEVTLLCDLVVRSVLRESYFTTSGIFAESNLDALEKMAARCAIPIPPRYYQAGVNVYLDEVIRTPTYWARKKLILRCAAKAGMDVRAISKRVDRIEAAHTRKMYWEKFKSFVKLSRLRGCKG